MATERRFRRFMVAHAGLVEVRADGPVAVIGLSGSGDAVAVVVRSETVDELVSSLRAVRPPATPIGIPTVPGAFAGLPDGDMTIAGEPAPD